MLFNVADIGDVHVHSGADEQASRTAFLYVSLCERRRIRETLLVESIIAIRAKISLGYEIFRKYKFISRAIVFHQKITAETVKLIERHIETESVAVRVESEFKVVGFLAFVVVETHRETGSEAIIT